jgi:hypothetical protein
MSPDVPPAGFEPHDRRSPLTAPWEPIYCNAHGAWVVWASKSARRTRTLGAWCTVDSLPRCSTTSWGSPAARHCWPRGSTLRASLPVSLGVEYLGMAKLGQWLTFEPHFVKTGRTLCFAEASAAADGVIVARGRSTFRTGVAR